MYTHTHTYIYIYIYVHTYMHTHPHPTQTHAYTQAWSGIRTPWMGPSLGFEQVHANIMSENAVAHSWLTSYMYACCDAGKVCTDKIRTCTIPIMKQLFTGTHTNTCTRIGARIHTDLHAHMTPYTKPSSPHDNKADPAAHNEQSRDLDQTITLLGSGNHVTWIKVWVAETHAVRHVIWLALFLRCKYRLWMYTHYTCGRWIQMWRMRAILWGSDASHAHVHISMHMCTWAVCSPHIHIKALLYEHFHACVLTFIHTHTHTHTQTSVKARNKQEVRVSVAYSI
jgi:hypothetical protein